MKELIALLAALLPLLKPNPEGQSRKQDRKDLKEVRRMRKRVFRRIKKDGITTEEQEIIDKIDQAILDRTLELGQ